MLQMTVKNLFQWTRILPYNVLTNLKRKFRLQQTYFASRPVIKLKFQQFPGFWTEMVWQTPFQEHKTPTSSLNILHNLFAKEKNWQQNVPFQNCFEALKFWCLSLALSQMI